MFSLIVTVISIALVAALAIATLYFGGEAFNQGTLEAKASTVVNQAQQIDGANTIYRTDEGSYAGNLSNDLVSDYLGSTPAVDDSISTSATGWTVAGTGDRTVILDSVVDGVCDKIDEQVGLDPTATTGDEAAVATAEVPYGCDDTGTFYFSPDN